MKVTYHRLEARSKAEFTLLTGNLPADRLFSASPGFIDRFIVGQRTVMHFTGENK